MGRWAGPLEASRRWSGPRVSSSIQLISRVRKVGDLKDTGGSLNLESWGGWVAKEKYESRAALRLSALVPGSLWHRTPNVARNEIYSPAKTVRALRKPQFQCLSFRKSWKERRARASKPRR